MKSFLPLLTLVVLFASCTAAYKSGYTPDDVYFSPQRPQNEYVQVENKRDRYRYQDQEEDDRYLRMKVRNRRMWSDLDYYYSDPYAYNYYYNRYNNYYFNNSWNPYSYWNYYYNPYGPQVVVVNPKAPVYNRPRQYNLSVFDNPQSSGNSKSPRSTRVFGDDGYSQPSYNESRRNAGSSLRDVFGGSSNSGSPASGNTPSRIEPRNSGSSSGPSSSGSSNNGGNAPVRRF